MNEENNKLCIVISEINSSESCPDRGAGGFGTDRYLITICYEFQAVFRIIKDHFDVLSEAGFDVLENPLRLNDETKEYYCTVENDGEYEGAPAHYRNEMKWTIVPFELGQDLNLDM